MSLKVQKCGNDENVTVIIQWNLDITDLPYNEVLGITNDFVYPSSCKIYGKEPRCNETSLWQTIFASPLALRYIEVPLYSVTPLVVRETTDDASRARGGKV